jgi:hypothetical protein
VCARSLHHGGCWRASRLGIAHPRRHAREAAPPFLKDRFWLPLLNLGCCIALFSDSQNLHDYYSVNIFGIWHLNFRLFC